MYIGCLQSSCHGRGISVDAYNVWKTEGQHRITYYTYTYCNETIMIMMIPHNNDNTVDSDNDNGETAVSLASAVDARRYREYVNCRCGWKCGSVQIYISFEMLESSLFPRDFRP